MKMIFLVVIFTTLHNISFAQNSNLERTHDFDFWVGNWDVYKYGTDTLVGKSKINSTLNHMVIEEEYQSTNSTYMGKSYNSYNTSKKRWEQHWVDNSGLILHITGGLIGNQMILFNQDDTICNRIVWTAFENNQVRQEWFQAGGDCSKWNKIFDGHYKPIITIAKAEIAFPDLAKFSNVRDLTLSKNGKEAYVTIQNASEDIRTICVMRLYNGDWSPPKPASFSGEFQDIEPFLSPDNLSLFFASKRPNIHENLNYDIWVVRRENLQASWSEPVNLGSPINSSKDEFYPSVSSNGNLYYTSLSEGTKGEDDIFCARLRDGRYLEPTSLDGGVNSESYEFNSYIAEDESFIIFSGYNRTDGLGSGDMYISYRTEDGKWLEASLLKEGINSKSMDYCPFYHADQKKLYFTSRRYEEAAKKLTHAFDLRNNIIEGSNGSSKIYCLDLELSGK